MKDKKLVVAAVIVLAAVIIGVMFMAKPSKVKAPAKTARAQKASQALKPSPVKSAPVKPAPAKKVFSKGMGGLTVRILGTGNREAGLRCRAFKAIDPSTSLLVASFNTNRMQELVPGNYDIEIESSPQAIYKNISVSEGKETVKDLGRPTGAIEVKALNSANKPAPYSVKLLYPNSSFVAATFMTNRPVEVLSGTYDVEIAITPKRVEYGVRVEAGKDKALDMGAVTGSLTVKAFDEGKKELKLNFKVKNQAKGDVIANGVTGRLMELVPGTYAIDLASSPAQTKGDVKVSGGSASDVEFAVETPKPAAAAVPVPEKKKVQ